MVVILFSRIWGAVLAIVLVPVYVKLLGIESYGLVAFYGTLAGALALLDLGLSASISRQVAIYKTQHNKEKDLNDLVFSVEIINWAIALVVGILIVVLSNNIAIHWVKNKTLPIATIQQSVMLMGLIFAFQFPTSVYDGAMVGLQKQNANAVLNIVFTTLKALGVLLVLKFVSQRIEAYFIWQAIVTLVYTVAMRWYVKQKIKVAGVKPIFSKEQLKIIWRFAVGITGIALVTFFITQIDKIVVSRDLVQLSYYSLAFLLSSGINAIVSPMQSIIYPKLTQFVATNNNDGLVALFHKSSKWISIIVFPIGFTLLFFANEILLLWTKNETLTTHTAPILQVVVAGTLFNCMMMVPYFVTLAKGNTKYGLYQNIIAAIITVPLLFWWVSNYGALGASWVWLTVNAGIFFISIPVFNYLYFNKKQYWHWLINDVLWPLLFAGIIAFGCKYFQKQFLPNITIPYFAILMLFAMVIYLCIITETRNFIKNIIISLNKPNK